VATTASVASQLQPIGVFDSGVGGLTVLRSLQQTLPQESFVYLGDTARLPYGTKSAETVERYALQAADALVQRGIKALVVACNTASAAALDSLRARFPQLPVIGVIEPGVRAVVTASRSGRILVLATEGTVRGGAYQRAIATLRPDARVTAVACQLFVALAEEGWISGEVVEATIARYLRPMFGAAMGTTTPDAVVLGCTHFPVLRAAIAAAVGPSVALVDSAATTALAVRERLMAGGLCVTGPGVAQVRFLATDSAERFAAVGSRFLGREIRTAEAELIDL
jgi:glutamate racemase